MTCNVMFSPFALMEQWQALCMKQSAALWQANMAAAETIFRRTSMMGQVASGRIAPTHPEFSRMWEEKMHSGMKGQMAMMAAWQDAALRYRTTPKTAEAALSRGLRVAEQVYDAGVGPGFGTVKRNAKRLRKT